MQFALETEQDVALAAPVVGQVAGGVFHHADPQIAELAGAPVGHAGVAGVFGAFHLGPVRGAEGDVAHLHRESCGVVRTAGGGIPSGKHQILRHSGYQFLLPEHRTARGVVQRVALKAQFAQPIWRARSSSAPSSCLPTPSP
ncbi:hypothetical protein G6F35_017067 [Rhizopus arrhizus]|nr:hypothetical protein G6F35_017067 [Rhizopus arrhizus]